MIERVCLSSGVQPCFRGHPPTHERWLYSPAAETGLAPTPWHPLPNPICSPSLLILCFVSWPLLEPLA